MNELSICGTKRKTFTASILTIFGHLQSTLYIKKNTSVSKKTNIVRLFLGNVLGHSIGSIIVLVLLACNHDRK